MGEQNIGIRVRTKKPPFTIIHNHILECPKLSWKAKAILAYLLGRPDGWKGKVYHLAKIGLDGPKAIRAAFAELRREGWARLESEVSGGNTGRFMDRFYTVSDEPEFYGDPDNVALRKKEAGLARKWQRRGGGFVQKLRSVIPAGEGGHGQNGHDPFGHDPKGNDQNGHHSKKEPSNQPAQAQSFPEGREKTTTITSADATGGSGSGGSLSPDSEVGSLDSQRKVEAQEQAKVFQKGWVKLIQKVKGHPIVISQQTAVLITRWFEKHPRWSGVDLVNVAFLAMVNAEENPRPEAGENDPYFYSRRWASEPGWFKPNQKDNGCKIFETIQEVGYIPDRDGADTVQQLSQYLRQLQAA